MRAVVLDVPQELIEERRRKGLDLFDEVWDGVLHMVPPPSGRHQRLGSELLAALLPIARTRGLIGSYETGLFRPDAGERDYRVPDLVFARPEHLSERGVEGHAELVVEILSPGDETYEKLPFYETVGVIAFLVLDPIACTVELFVRRGARLHALLPDAGGSTAVESLGVSFATAPGPALRLSWPAGTLDL